MAIFSLNLVISANESKKARVDFVPWFGLLQGIVDLAQRLFRLCLMTVKFPLRISNAGLRRANSRCAVACPATTRVPTPFTGVEPQHDSARDRMN